MASSEDRDRLVPFQRYEEELRGAVASGKVCLLEMVIDKIREQDPELTKEEIANLPVLDGLTLTQAVATAGKDELFQWLANVGYGCSDPSVMTAARKLVTAKAAMNTEQNFFKVSSFVHILRDKHRLTGRYYSVLHTYMLYVPGLMISTTAALLAFISTAKQISTETQSSIALAVGALSVAAALLQTISDQLQLSGKALQHTAAADELTKVLTDLDFGYTSTEDLLGVREKVHNIGKTCSYQMHTRVESLFDELVSEMAELRDLAAREANYDVPLQEQADRKKADINAVWSAISNDPYWPWRLRVKEIKEAALEELRNDTLRLLSSQRNDEKDAKAQNELKVFPALQVLYKNKAESQRKQVENSRALEMFMTMGSSPPRRAGAGAGGRGGEGGDEFGAAEAVEPAERTVPGRVGRGVAPRSVVSTPTAGVGASGKGDPWRRGDRAASTSGGATTTSTTTTPARGAGAAARSGAASDPAGSTTTTSKAGATASGTGAARGGTARYNKPADEMMEML